MADATSNRLLRLLPGIYRESPYLAEFLRPFEAVLLESWRDGSGRTQDGFARLFDRIDGFFDPARTPADFLPWLAGWFALDLDDGWDEARRRQYIREALDLYRWRGTVRGLTRFIEIYTGQRPLIHECRWPAGMQIGTASMIGGLDPDVHFATFTAERQAEEVYDYYLVTEDGPPTTVWYYRADRVRRVDVDPVVHTVTLDYLEPDAAAVSRRTHVAARVTRRDGLPATSYHLSGLPVGGGDAVTAEYRGDTIFIDTVEMPYRFIVDVVVDADKLDEVRVDKVRAIIDLEKPAHTLYYLRMIPVYREETLQRMQIEVRSTIGSDAVVG